MTHVLIPFDHLCMLLGAGAVETEVCNGRALASSSALLHSAKSAIALLNEEKLVLLLHCLFSAPAGCLSCQHNVTIR